MISPKFNLHPEVYRSSLIANDHNVCQSMLLAVPILYLLTRQFKVCEKRANLLIGLQQKECIDTPLTHAFVLTVHSGILSMAKGGVSVVVGVNLDEQLSKFPAHLLDVPCADAHLVQLAECFSEWQTRLSTSLQLTAVEVEDIERAWPRDPAMQRVKIFRRWKYKLSSQGTYRSVV